MTKRALAALLTSGVVVALAGGPAVSLAQSPAAGEPLSGELLIWDTGILGRLLEGGEPDMERSFIDQMAVKFEELHPGVDVTVVQQGGDITTNGAQFQAASIAGNGPDIRIQYAGGPTISFADFFTDLEPLLTPEIIDSMAGFNVNREGFKPDGRMLGMPYGAGNMFTVFANNEMLEAAGLDPSDPPDTWEELMANGQQILDTTGQVPFWVANLEGYVGAWVVSALAGGELGETIFTRMYTGEVPINVPEMVKVYEKWAEFGASGLTNPDAGQVSNGDSTAGFVQGKGAYYIVGSWENNNMIENFGDNVSTFFIPMLEGAPYPAMGAGGPEIAISVTEYSDQKELAGEFLRFLAQPENQDVFVTLYQTQASNHKDGDPALIQNRLLQEQFKQLAESTDGIVFAFDSVLPQSVIDLFYRVNAGVFLGNITPQDAVDQLQAANQQEISQRQ
jgi:ABC-type glycerol-3-phosphate transport system substrate-binding protein